MTEELRELLLSDDHEDNLLGVNIMRAKKMKVQYWLRKISSQEFHRQGYTFFRRYFDHFPPLRFVDNRWPRFTYVLRDEFTNN